MLVIYWLLPWHKHTHTCSFPFSVLLSVPPKLHSDRFICLLVHLIYDWIATLQTWHLSDLFGFVLNRCSIRTEHCWPCCCRFAFFLIHSTAHPFPLIPFTLAGGRSGQTKSVVEICETHFVRFNWKGGAVLEAQCSDCWLRRTNSYYWLFGKTFSSEKLFSSSSNNNHFDLPLFFSFYLSLSHYIWSICVFFLVDLQYLRIYLYEWITNAYYFTCLNSFNQVVALLHTELKQKSSEWDQTSWNSPFTTLNLIGFFSTLALLLSHQLFDIYV